MNSTKKSLRFISISNRLQKYFSSNPLNTQESRITLLLESALKPSSLEVKDTSGGCGAMFDIKVTSSLFQGKTLVAQHKMVKATIADEIKSIHGLTVSTKVTKSD